MADRENRRCWYVVQSQTNREQVAESHLKRQNYQVFVPCQRKTIRHARRTMTRRAAFFPGYLFVCLDLDKDHWRPINGTIGVRSLIANAHRPVAMPSGIVESLIAITNEEGYLVSIFDLQNGDQVRILAGHFVNMIGRLERLDNKGRVRVLVEMMNSRIPVVLEHQDVAPA